MINEQHQQGSKQRNVSSFLVKYLADLNRKSMQMVFLLWKNHTYSIIKTENKKFSAILICTMRIS